MIILAPHTACDATEPVRLLLELRKAGYDTADIADAAGRPAWVIRDVPRWRWCPLSLAAAIRSAHRELMEYPPDPAYIDPVVIYRLVTGDRVKATRAERLEAVRQMAAKGMSLNEIAYRLRSSQRQVTRDLAALAGVS